LAEKAIKERLLRGIRLIGLPEILGFRWRDAKTGGCLVLAGRPYTFTAKRYTFPCTSQVREGDVVYGYVNVNAYGRMPHAQDQRRQGALASSRPCCATLALTFEDANPQAGVLTINNLSRRLRRTWVRARRMRGNRRRRTGPTSWAGISGQPARCACRPGRAAWS
jgi:hypothetical protein